VAHRQAGLGSLGRERFTAISEWRGGRIAREAKALLPSACVWPMGATGEKKILYAEILRRAVRAADPFVSVQRGWLLRRLSPYCSRIELFQLRRGHEEKKLLEATGRELANVHLGSPSAVSAVRRDLKRRSPKWLRQAAEIMAKETKKDWREWAKQFA
jgi:hypothetical protein